MHAVVGVDCLSHHFASLLCRNLTRELRRCFDLWERKAHVQGRYSVSSAVIESCKKLLSQVRMYVCVGAAAPTHCQ